MLTIDIDIDIRCTIGYCYQ